MTGFTGQTMSFLGHDYGLFAALSSIPTRPLLATIAIIIAHLIRHPILTALKTLLSRVVHFILLRRFPIAHLSSGAALPSLNYNFPDGQGNVEKFLHGRSNSARWETEYGSLYRLWSGLKGEVVLTKAVHVKAVFHDSHAHSKAHANDSGYLMEQLLGSCLGLINGQSWSTLKAAVELPFLHKSTDAYAEDVQHFTCAYLDQLNSQKNDIHQNGLFHPVQDVKLLPFLYVARVIYGPLSESLEEELMDLIQPRDDLFKSVVGGGITRFSWSKYLPLPAIRALHNFKTRFAQWSDRAHANALASSTEKSTPVIGMYGAVKEGKITREQLLQTLDEMLFANIDVTMGGLSWTLVLLAAHPTIQDALRAEIHEHGVTPEARKAYLCSSWTTKPTVLGACILESARLRPLAAFSVPQSCPTPRVLDGYQIPAGTNFIVDSYALNIRDPFWGEDRDRFVPGRWLERQKSGRDLRYRYWRFGFGPRTCLGRHLADLILRTVVVEILKRWHLGLEDTPNRQRESKKTGSATKEEMDWPWDDEMWIHHPDLQLQYRPLGDAKVVVP